MKYVLSILALSIYLGAHAADDALLDSLRSSFPSASSYSRKVDDSGAVKEMYIFFDKEGKPLGGAAVRAIKTYGKVTGVLAVRKSEDVVEVIDVSFPDLRKIRKSSERRTVLKAARRANGRVVMEHGKKKELDAVSGATRYNRNLFLNLNKMASILVDEINAGQDGEKIKLK